MSDPTKVKTALCAVMVALGFPANYAEEAAGDLAEGLANGDERPIWTAPHYQPPDPDLPDQPRRGRPPSEWATIWAQISPSQVAMLRSALESYMGDVEDCGEEVEKLYSEAQALEETICAASGLVQGRLVPRAWVVVGWTDGIEERARVIRVEADGRRVTLRFREGAEHTFASVNDYQWESASFSQRCELTAAGFGS